MNVWIGNHGYQMCKYGLIHRLVSCADPDDIVHHKDGNKLNNDPNNLYKMNSQSQHASEHGLKNRYMDGKGKVWRNKAKNPELKCWEVRIMFNGHRKRLGLYEDPITAQLVYDLVWRELHEIQKQ